METGLETTFEDKISNHCDKSMENALLTDRHALWQRVCPELSDIMFVRLGILRVLAQVDSGRHFLQYTEEILNDLCFHSTYFKALSSKRRMEMTRAIEKESYIINCTLMELEGIDYLSDYPELDEYTVEAVDGHFIDHAEHTPTNAKGKVYAAGFIFGTNLRNGLLRSLCCVTNGTNRNHELPIFRDYIDKENEKQKQKCITVYDKAITDFTFWDGQKKFQHYVITQQKENAVTEFVQEIAFDKKSEINIGVESYELHKCGGAIFSIVKYRDPETGILHTFITTVPPSINPGLVALLYFKRWTIEKIYDNSKNDLKEKKAWSSNKNALNNQMCFMAMSYNTVRLAEEISKIQEPELIHTAVKKYDDTLLKRQEKAEENERFVNPLFFRKRIARLSSFTIRAVQFAIIKGTSYITLMNELKAKLIPRHILIREH